MIARALGLADKSYVLPVYSAGEEALPHSSSEEILRHCGGTTEAADFDAIGATLKRELKSGDLLLTMGAGDVYKLGEIFLNESQSI